MNTRILSFRPHRGWKWSRLVPLLLLSGGLAPLAPQAAYAQVAGPRTVMGKITAATGEGLPGVTVVVKGTTQGTSTDVNGNFTLNAPEGSVLIFSSVGYTTREVAAPLAVVLSENVQALDDMVVWATAPRKKAR